MKKETEITKKSESELSEQELEKVDGGAVSRLTGGGTQTEDEVYVGIK